MGIQPEILQCAGRRPIPGHPPPGHPPTPGHLPPRGTPHPGAHPTPGTPARATCICFYQNFLETQARVGTRSRRAGQTTGRGGSSSPGCSCVFYANTHPWRWEPGRAASRLSGAGGGQPARPPGASELGAGGPAARTQAGAALPCATPGEAKPLKQQQKRNGPPGAGEDGRGQERGHGFPGPPPAPPHPEPKREWPVPAGTGPG